jgi:hypothetical protein
MPSGTATSAVTRIVNSPSRNDTGAAAEIIAQTDRPEVSELPKLPCRRFQM